LTFLPIPDAGNDLRLRTVSSNRKKFSIGTVNLDGFPGFRFAGAFRDGAREYPGMPTFQRFLAAGFEDKPIHGTTDERRYTQITSKKPGCFRFLEFTILYRISVYLRSSVVSTGFAFRARMRCVIHLREMLKIQVRINLRRRNARMAEHLLHRAQITARLQHVRSERMMQH